MPSRMITSIFFRRLWYISLPTVAYYQYPTPDIHHSKVSRSVCLSCRSRSLLFIQNYLPKLWYSHITYHWVLYKVGESVLTYSLSWILVVDTQQRGRRKFLRPLDYLAISTLPSTASLSKINSRSQFFTGQYQLSLCRSYDVCHVESAIVRLVFPTVKRIDALFIATPIRNSDHELQKPGSIVNFKYLLALNLHSLGLSSPRIRLG